jgi:type IV secretory pathway VirB3-like protein
MALTKCENMKIKIILIFYMAKKCLYIKEKNFIVHVFHHLKKSGKNYKGKLWRTSKIFQTQYKFGKLKKN